MKGQIPRRGVQEATPMGIASDTCSHISGLAGLPQHSFFQHGDWIQTHSQIQKLQILEFIKYHVIINWWNCSVLTRCSSPETDMYFTYSITPLTARAHNYFIQLVMYDQHFPRHKCDRVTSPSGLQHFYSLAVCSLQFLPHTLQGQQNIREKFLQDWQVMFTPPAWAPKNGPHSGLVKLWKASSVKFLQKW